MNIAKVLQPFALYKMHKPTAPIQYTDTHTKNQYKKAGLQFCKARRIFILTVLIIAINLSIIGLRVAALLEDCFLLLFEIVYRFDILLYKHHNGEYKHRHNGIY